MKIPAPGSLSDVEPPYLLVKPGVTEEEFYRWANEDSNCEYLDGRVVVHSPASERHEDLFGFLYFLLRGYVEEKKIGVARGSRYPMRLDPRWSPEPEILVVLNEHRQRMGPARLEGPADFVIEVCSESDPELDYREKLPRYRDARIPEIWIVDPFKGHIHAEPAAAPFRLVRTGRLDSSAVKGFWIDVGWLWEPELPSPLPCLNRILKG